MWQKGTGGAATVGVLMWIRYQMLQRCWHAKVRVRAFEADDWIDLGDLKGHSYR